MNPCQFESSRYVPMKNRDTRSDIVESIIRQFEWILSCDSKLEICIENRVTIKNSNNK